MSDQPNGRALVHDDQQLLEARAAEARLRLMRTMDALGKKRRDVVERGTRYATLGAAALVLGVGAVAVGLAAAAMLSRRREERGGLFGMFMRRGFAPPRRERSIVNDLLLRALMGAATVGFRMVTRGLTQPEPSSTPRSLGEGR